VVKNPPAMQETQVRFLDQKDPLEKEMATQYPCLGNPVDCTSHTQAIKSRSGLLSW